jgi:hypothetical protein
MNRMTRVVFVAVLATAAIAFLAAPADAGLFRARHGDSCCDPCEPTVVQTLVVCHPCTGCKHSIEVCLPACCTGEPCVYERCTLFGCGATMYEWDCGARVVVRFWRNGDITVKYR